MHHHQNILIFFLLFSQSTSRIAENIPTVISHQMRFQQDSALAHLHRDVPNHLHAFMPLMLWIRCDKPIWWPLISPNLSWIDFFLQGHHLRSNEEQVSRLPITACKSELNTWYFLLLFGISSSTLSNMYNDWWNFEHLL